MATGTVRFGIIVALVIVGAVLIAQFPSSPTASLATEGTGTPSQSESPSPTGGGTGSGNGTGTQETPTAQVKGVKLAVYNGTLQTGLAADAAADLVDQFGYRINSATSILDAADKPIEQTTLYYVSPDDKIEAEALKDSYFKAIDPKVAKMPADLPKAPDGVRVAVYLGNDYAGTR